MVLNISGIDKLIGQSFHNRTIEKVTLAARWSKESASYVFHFPAIPYSGPKNPHRYKTWYDDFEVHLCRYPKHGKVYELFVMGLHGVTYQELYWEDIQNFPNFIASFGVVVGRSKKYWEENT
jgi:hypothetical protein